MASYPDYGKAPPDYVVTFVEALSYLKPDEIAALTHPTEGLAARCKFLPTVADAHELLRERRAKAEQFAPAYTNWKKIEDHPNAPWNKETDFERKKRVVRELLGYSPGEVAQQRPKNLVPPEPGFKVELKTPAAPPSEALKKLLREQGWPVVETQERKEA